ncbi:tetratricopeptide repeat protein [Rufibacter glacialis]|uniref:Tetratricopeptide repeat protein n=2 Tax=Rufibacter glacialis TaxID=1259555 RepID=A0A5M8QBU5_9BACT|nr:tetratricopeptide repeat protein [Rufibacter glacialis]
MRVGGGESVTGLSAVFRNRGLKRSRTKQEIVPSPRQQTMEFISGMRYSLLFLGLGMGLLSACSQKTSEERMFHPQKVDSSIPTHINEISRALDQRDPQPEWYVKRAKLYLSLNQATPALKDLTKATALDPSLGEAYFYKAKILLQGQQYQETMRMMMQAKAFNYYSPESEAILTETYVGLKQYERALGHGLKAIKLSPSEAKHYVLLAQAQVGTGDTTRALVNLQRALVRDSVSLPAFRELSAIYTARKLYDYAYPLVQQGVRKQPQDGFWWQQLGQYFLSRNQTDTALATFSRAINLNPKQAQAYAGLGEAWYKKRQYSTALPLLEKARELGLPMTEHNRWILASCLEWTGQKEAARQQYVFLTRKYPQNRRYSVALQRVTRPVPQRTIIDTLSGISVF